MARSSIRERRAKAKADFEQLRDRMRDPLLTALAILLAFWMFVLAPLHATGRIDTDIAGLVLALGVSGALLILSGKPGPMLVMLAAISMAAAAAWFRLQQPSNFDVGLNATAWTLISVTLIVVVGRAVFAPGRITYHRIMGAIVLYFAIGLLFVALFTFVGLGSREAFTGMEVRDSPLFSSTMIYFSFGTLTTAGSGDIAPLNPIARSLCNIEAMIGQLYPATLLARLVTLEIESEGKD
jgi:hypothetical protein